MSRLSILALVALLLGGCGSSADTSPVPKISHEEATKGWQTISSPKENISLKVPPDWIGVDLVEGDYEKALEKLGKEALAANGQLQALAKDGKGKLFAINPAAATFAENLSVTKEALDKPATPNDIAIQEQLGLEKAGAKVVNKENVSLPAGKAVLLRSTTSIPTGKDTATELALFSYILVDGKTLYELTITTVKEGSDFKSADFKNIAESLQIGK